MNAVTPRQLAIIELMAEGHTSEEIAVRLGLSRYTVRRHVYLACDRLGITATSPGHRLVALYASGQLTLGKMADFRRT